MSEHSESRITSFYEFYPYYLSEHLHPVNRVLHFIGSALGLLLFINALSGNFLSILYAILIGYGLAWIGHFLIEKNRPATFKYPFYSFMGDWKMFFELLTRRRSFDERAN